MKEIVERVVNAFAQKHPQITSELERKVHDGISDFVAELLSKRADQLAKLADKEPRA